MLCNGIEWRKAQLRRNVLSLQRTKKLQHGYPKSTVPAQSTDSIGETVNRGRYAHAIFGAKLVENSVDVVLDGLLGKAELLGYFFIG